MSDRTARSDASKAADSRAPSGSGGAGHRPARAVAGESPRWWAVRRAQNSKPATYTCPFCRRRLHAMSEHVLIAPEGDTSHRRHAHAECVARAREAGRFVTYDDWRAAQPRRSFWRRLTG